MRKLLALNGLQPGDFRVKTIEGTATRFNCLKRGECDAVPLGQPQDLIAVKDGYRLLGLSTDAVPDFIYTVTAARRSWAEKNKEPVLRYVRGLAAAFKFIREPANRAAVVKTIVDWSESSADIAEQTPTYISLRSAMSCRCGVRSTSRVWLRSSLLWARGEP